jgi:uncharacterized protein (TIGR03000 family)
MYSIVLMAAMTTGGEVTDFGRRGGGCCGCYGGYGGYRGYRCSGGYGCRGGGYGCYGGGYGCYGGGYGCYGGYGGGYGGYGMGYGRGYRTGYGGWGWGYGGYYGTPYSPSMYGVSYGSPVKYTAQAPIISTPTTGPPAAAPATFVVHLPADAKLTVEGTPTTSTSSRRVFVSPPLQPGQSYTYHLDAQVTRNGQTETVQRDLPVRAGQQTEITLDFPTTTTSVRR